MRSLAQPRAAAPAKRDWATLTGDALMFAAVMLGAAALVFFLGASSARWAG